MPNANDGKACYSSDAIHPLSQHITCVVVESGVHTNIVLHSIQDIVNPLLYDYRMMIDYMASCCFKIPVWSYPNPTI